MRLHLDLDVRGDRRGLRFLSGESRVRLHRRLVVLDLRGHLPLVIFLQVAVSRLDWPWS
jgi:hypothetical protein